MSHHAHWDHGKFWSFDCGQSLLLISFRLTLGTSRFDIEKFFMGSVLYLRLLESIFRVRQNTHFCSERHATLFDEKGFFDLRPATTWDYRSLVFLRGLVKNALPLQIKIIGGLQVPNRGSASATHFFRATLESHSIGGLFSNLAIGKFGSIFRVFMMSDPQWFS